MSWYKTGEEGKRQAEEEARRAAENANKPRRFWMRPGAETEVIFLDSEGFYFYEHDHKVAGKFGNFETCIVDMGQACAFCDGGYRRSYVCAFTVIDLTQFTTKTGQLVTASKKLYVVKGTAIKKLIRKRDAQNGDLRFAKLHIFRDGPKDNSSGSDFDFVERLTEEQVKALRPTSGNFVVPENEWTQPYNYYDVFAPKSEIELRRILGQAPPAGAEDDPVLNTPSTTETASVEDDDSIPF